MSNPHDKSPTLVRERGQLLLPMQERFFCVVKRASQVRTLPEDPDIFTFDMSASRPTHQLLMSEIYVLKKHRTTYELHYKFPQHEKWNL